MKRDPATENERRNQERFEIRVPLYLRMGTSNVPALTRNPSNHGVYFYLAASESPQVDQELDFEIELPPEMTWTHNSVIHCRGRALRTETVSSDETGVAAAISNYSIFSDGNE